MPRRLRILSLSSTFPYPPIGGTKILVFRQITEMARHHDVDLVAVDHGDATTFDRSGLPDCRSITSVPIATAERRFSLREKVATTIATRHPFFIYQRYSPVAQKLIDERLAGNDYDVVIAEDGEAGVYVKSTHRALRILSKHAIMSVQRDQLAAIAPSVGRRWLDRFYARLIRRYERSEAARFDLIKLPTRDDLERWRRIVGDEASPTFTVSNGVDVSYFDFHSRTGPVDRLIFTANMAGPQNADAAEWFVDRVYPKVAEHGRQLPLYLVGRDPTPELRSKASEHITVTGSVPDVRPFYGRKPIAVVPLRIASGIINKVLEPMAMGVGVVASSAAVAGLDVPADRVCLVADDPEAFARAVVRLANDEALYTRLTTAAHEYVTTSHVWPALLAQYRARIESAAGGT